MSIIYLILCVILGLWFILNQIDELFSLLTVNTSEEISLILLCLYIHLSHLVLSVCFLLKSIKYCNNLLNDIFINFFKLLTLSRICLSINIKFIMNILKMKFIII